ncbi:MAG: hypothetical protein M3478_11450 [Planctomycetota bacterium]|nr:hypothetical protein [Planctomycetota bacterium]
MFVLSRWFLSALLMFALCAAGCGEDKAGETSYDDGTASAAKGDGAIADAEVDDPDAPADQPTASAANKPLAIPTPDVPIPPGVKEEDVGRAGWVTYGAAQKAAELASFYQKDLTAKGWTLGRNETKPLAGTTLSGGIQEYRKGSDVLTVCLTEQPATEGTMTMVAVIDIPLPPKTTQVVAFANQVVIETPESPDEAIALMTKNLAPLGWSTPKPASEAGGTKSVGFVKGNRSLSTNVRAGSGQKGSSMTLMHLAYAG